MSPDKTSKTDELRRKAEALLARSPEILQPADLDLIREMTARQAELERQNDELRRVQSEVRRARSELEAQNDKLNHTNRVLLGIRNVNQLIVSEEDPRRLIERACLDLTENLGYFNVWIALIGGESARILGLPYEDPVCAVASEGFSTGFSAMAERLKHGTFPSCMKRTLLSEEVVLSIDPVSDCPDCPISGEYEDRASMACRLAFDGTIFGILTASIPTAYAGTREERDLFKELADDLSFALHKIATTRRLAESRRRYRELFEHSRDGFVMINEKWQIIDANEAFCEMLGIPLEELRALPDFLAVTPERWQEWESREIWRNRLLKRGYSGLYEKEFIRKDGTVFPVEMSSHAVRRENGEIDYLWSLVRDIRERKQAEDILLNEQQRLRMVIEGSGLGTWEWNIQTGETIFNETWATILGYRLEELAPIRIDSWIALTHPEDYRKAKALLEPCLSGERPEYTCELRMKHKDGHWVWILDRGRVMTRDDRGRPLWMFGTHSDITEVKEREERLTLLGKMLDDAPAGITIHDMEGRFLFSNRQNMLLHGYKSEEDFLAVNLHRLDDPESEAMLAERFRRIAEEGEARFEVQHFHQNGSTFPLEVTAKAIDWHGQPAVLSIAIDITERRKMENALRESEERFQKMLSLVPDMVSIHDPDMNILYSNWNGFGKVPSEKRILNTKCYTTYRGLDTVCPDCKAKTVLETRKPFQSEVQLPNGMWIDLRVIPMLDQHGQVESFVEWVKDISDWKQAEDSLRESEENHRRLFETMSQGVVYQARDGTIISANPSAERILGLSFDQMRGKSSMDPRWKMIKEDGSAVSGSDHPAMWALRTGQTVGPVIRGVFRPDQNTHVWLNIISIPLFLSGESEPFKVYSTFEDITERKEAEAEREKLQSQLSQSQKMESVGRLAGGVAHDFNNMLGVILGHAEMALKNTDPDSPFRNRLEQISKAAERSANLTRQLLAFARKQTIDPKVLDINQTIGSMLKMLERLIGEDIDLLWKPGAGLFLICIDPGQMDQLLANLVVNARDAIRHDHGKIVIETDNILFDEAYCAGHPGFSPGEYAMLEVSDNGCGMDKETLSCLFEPFFTTKELGKGTGLGLAMVYGIVKQNNGFIHVYSEPGQGTTFRIYLPRHLEKETLPTEKEEAKPRPPVQATILLVEDEPAILSMTTLMLTQEGHTVLAAGTSAEAIQLAKDYSGEIHLLISDVVMPDMNGRELAERITSIFPAMKCLFMSGYTADVIAHHGVLDEGVHFIQKPFTTDGLMEKLHEVLGVLSPISP